MNGQLIVESNDPFQQQTVIQLQGSGIAPEINLSSGELQFGQVQVFSDSMQILKFRKRVLQKNIWQLLITNLQYGMKT